MTTIRGRTLFTVAAALVLLGCPPPDAEREEVEERPDDVAVDERRDAAVDPADAAWSVQLSGAEQGTVRGETAVQEETPAGMALRLESDIGDEQPPITMMLVLAGVDEGATGPFEAENATVMIGATSYFHAPGEPTEFTVQIQEYDNGRVAGTFSGTLRPDGPGESLELEGSFETDDGIF